MFDLIPSTNPFPGLRPFEAHENHLFFGRDGQSDDLLLRLSRQRFIAVVGTSGSGKSSLVRAGLLPALHGGFMLKAGSNWRVAIMRPGSNPVGRLARALCAEDVLGVDRAEEEIHLSIAEASLRRSALGLIDVVRQARLGSQDNLLIVVDQFEELFRVRAGGRPGDNADDAAAFVKLLLEATRQAELPIYVLITMRSDFLGDCSQFRDLPEAINDGQYLIPRMTRDQRREAISGPVAVGGARIAPRLVNRLLNDVGDNPDQLPLLQHALMRMWQQWEQEGDEAAPLDLSHYESVGGLDEAISRHAEEAYDELRTDRARRISEILFKLLTERGSDNREIRRPTRLAEVCSVAEAEEGEVLSVIEGFRREGRSFLMPPPGVTLHPNTFIDISHESLIRGWRRLQRWVDDEALSARIYRRLAETTQLHRAGEAGLWRDPDLAIALAWREKNRPNAAWGERYSPDFGAAMEFLDESRRARDAERLERERARRKNLRLIQTLAAVLLVGLCVSVALGAFASYQWNQAAERTRDAVRSALKAKESEQRAIAAEAVALKEKESAQEHARRALEAEAETSRKKEEAEENARRAMAAEAEASRKKEEAEASAKRAQLAEARAKESAVLAEQKAQEASENFKAAEAAQASMRKALDDAVRESVRAQKAERNAKDEKDRAYNLSIASRRESVEANSRILKMSQRLVALSPAEERAYWQTQEAEAWASLNHQQNALSLFKAALDKDQDNFAVLSAKGYQHLLSAKGKQHVIAEESRKALEDIERALKINRQTPVLYLNKALGLSYLGRYEDAVEATQKGIDLLTNLGYGKYRTRDVTEEVEKLTRQKIIYADSEEMRGALHYNKASLAAASGSKNFAADLAAADALPPSHAAYLYALNLSLLNFKARPNDYGALVAQGILWERAGYCDKAKDYYKSFRTEHEKAPQPRYNGLAQWLADNAHENSHGAGGVCRTVTENEKTERDYLLDMLEHAWAGDANRAEGILKTALKDVGDKPDFLIERMEVRYFLTEDFAAAKEDSEKLINMGKGTAGAYLIRAMAKTQLNAFETTIIDDVRSAKELDPAKVYLILDSGTEGKNGKALVDVLAKANPDEAIDFLRRSIQYNTPSAYAHYLLAQILNDKGRFEESLAQINKAIALDRSRLDFFKVKRRAEEGLLGGAGGANVPTLKLLGVQRNKFVDYINAGDTLSKRGQTAAALNAYGEGLTALNEIAVLSNNVEDVRCEVASTVEKIFSFLKTQGTKDEAVGYFKTLPGLKNISQLMKSELERLSAAP